MAAIPCFSACNEVTSGNDNVVVGAIYANLYLGDKVCDGSNPPFENVLWEPGMVAIETFTVKNEGTLAFKYTFGLDTEGVPQALIDCLRVAVIENYSESMTREEVMALFANPDATSDVPSFSVSGGVEAEASDTFTVAVYFDVELADNVTQDDVKDAKFGTHVIVTQVSSESDSFGQDYDPNVSYEDDTDVSVE